MLRYARCAERSCGLDAVRTWTAAITGIQRTMMMTLAEKSWIGRREANRENRDPSVVRRVQLLFIQLKAPYGGQRKDAGSGLSLLCIRKTETFFHKSRAPQGAGLVPAQKVSL